MAITQSLERRETPGTPGRLGMSLEFQYPVCASDNKILELELTFFATGVFSRGSTF